jgi:hypothetical protein
MRIWALCGEGGADPARENKPMSQQTEEKNDLAVSADAPLRNLSPAAERALTEAAARRAAIDAKAAGLTGAREINGRGGLEPVRYDDWEVKGIASDF